MDKSAADMPPLWEAGGYPPPAYTLSELALHQMSGEHIDIVVKRRKHNRNVFQRMRDALCRFFISKNWLKSSHGSGGTRRFNEGRHDVLSPDLVGTYQDSDSGDGRQCSSPLSLNPGVLSAKGECPK
jgi:hypothetical protein